MLQGLQQKVITHKYIIACLGLFTLVIYLPYFINGGFIVDDWGLAASPAGLWQNFISWFPLFANRPLAPVYLTITRNLFGAYPLGYILCNTALWLGAIVIIGLVLKKYFGKYFFVLFYLLASTPIISNSAIFSPGIQALNALSVFIWSLSFLSLDKYLSTRKIKYFILTFVLIAVCLLTYEIILPLLVLTVLYPLFIELKRPIEIKKVAKYLLPVIGVIGMIFVYQKVIIPKISISYSRLPDNFLSYVLHQGPFNFLHWLIDFVITTFSLIVSAFKSPTFGIALFSLALIAVVLIYFAIQNRHPQLPTLSRRSKYLVVIILLAFLACSGLFILNGTIAEFSGYLNRSLSTTWLTFCLLFAVVITTLHKRVFLVIGLIFVLATSLVFIVERDSYINSYQAQLEISGAVLADLQAQNYHDGAVVIGAVPLYLESDFNAAEVFSQSWDFGNVLKLESAGKVVDGQQVSAYKKINISNGKIYIDDWGTEINSNLWYAEYDQLNGTHSVHQVTSIEDMQNIVDHLPSLDTEIAPTPTVPRGRIRDLVDSILKRRYWPLFQGNLKNYLHDLI